MDLTLFLDEIDRNLKLLSAVKTGRLFHGRGGTFPCWEKVNVDFYDGLLFVYCYLEKKQSLPQALVSALSELKNNNDYKDVIHSVVVQKRFFGGGFQTENNIPSFYDGEEAGLKYRVQLDCGMNPGLFTDTQAARFWVRDFIKSKSGDHSLRVLNLFSYTCFFSVVAIASGADEVINVDLKSNVLNRGRENHRLNFGDQFPARFLKHDVMRSLGKLEKLGPYQLIILDPPSLQNSSFNLKKEYPRLLRRSIKMLSEDGRLLVCCNDPSLSVKWMYQLIKENAADCTLIDEITPSIGFREQNRDEGLKAFILALGVV